MLRSVSRCPRTGESGMDWLSGLLWTLDCLGPVEGDESFVNSVAGGEADRNPSGLPKGNEGECGGVIAAGRLGFGIGRAWVVAILLVVPVLRTRVSSLPKS
jgi:hypothetical protein